MNCEQRQDLIPLLPLGALEPQEAKEIRAHLAAGCAGCEGVLAQTDSLLSLFPLALPPAQPPAQVKDRLMSRIATRSPVAPSANRLRIGPALMGLAAGIIVAVGVSIALLGAQRRSSDALRAQIAQKTSQLRQKDNQIDLLKADVLTMVNALHNVASPTAQFVELPGAAAQPQAKGRMYVDRTRRTLLFAAEGLKSLPANKAYELWLVSGDQKIPVGTFTPDAQGKGSLMTAIAANIGPLAAAAVTDEPAAGVPQPTGQFQLLGPVTQ